MFGMYMGGVCVVEIRGLHPSTLGLDEHRTELAMSALLSKTGIRHAAGTVAVGLWSLSGGDKEINTFHQKEINANDPQEGARAARHAVISKGIN